MSRSLHTNRDFEKLEPYEGKPSRTVLRGEEGSNALDLPDLLTLSPLNWKQGKNISYRQNIMIIAIMLSQNCNGKFRKQEKLPASICMEKPGKQLASVKRWLL